MQFIKTDDLKTGMRLARPIYNKMGVMLYDRNTRLTSQGILSIKNFGLIGIYILEPAEPLPPITEEELAFEQFQTMFVFQLKDDMVLLKNRKPPKNLQALSNSIIERYSTLNHKIHFMQNIRSTSDYVYKHCLNTAILSAMVTGHMKFSSTDRNAIVCAALLHDIGKLLLPTSLLDIHEELTKDERRQIRRCTEEGYLLLQPDYNPYMLPELTLQIIGQLVHNEHNPDRPLDPSIHWHNGSQIIHIVDMFDTRTAMRLGSKPESELTAIRYLAKHPDYYPRNLVAILAQCIHILPKASCVDLSDGGKGMVLSENMQDFTKPIIIKFSNNEIYDLSVPEIEKKIQIVDIMKTMDNRIQIDEKTLEQFTSDTNIQEVTERYLKKRTELIKLGRL